jgi:hypothetical protein
LLFSQYCRLCATMRRLLTPTTYPTANAKNMIPKAFMLKDRWLVSELINGRMKVSPHLFRD